MSRKRLRPSKPRSSRTKLGGSVTQKHDFKRAAAENAKAFASTKSKDGQYPI